MTCRNVLDGRPPSHIPSSLSPTTSQAHSISLQGKTTDPFETFMSEQSISFHSGRIQESIWPSRSYKLWIIHHYLVSRNTWISGDFSTFSPLSPWFVGLFEYLCYFVISRRCIIKILSVSWHQPQQCVGKLETVILSFLTLPLQSNTNRERDSVSLLIQSIKNSELCLCTAWIWIFYSSNIYHKFHFPLILFVLGITIVVLCVNRTTASTLHSSYTYLITALLSCYH